MGSKRLDRDHPLATLDNYLDHIQHAVNVAGIDHVGLASDFDGGGAVQGWKDASQTRNVTAGLRRRGFTDAQIGQLWSGNLLRVWRDVERVAHRQQSAGKKTFDAIFDAVMAEYHLPGMALGVVEDGKVTYTRTAGELVSGGGQAIDADTLFKIASNTKAMTTGLLARLVDAGKLQWDDPVVKYLPQFKMSEPWITREMRVRDLLIHNSGLREGAGDLMLWPEPNNFTRADIIAGLAAPQAGAQFSFALCLRQPAVHRRRGSGRRGGRRHLRRVGAPRSVRGRRSQTLPGRRMQSRCGGQRGAASHVGGRPQPRVSGATRKSVPAIASAAAGGVRCSLNDMLTWMRMWLDPELASAGQDRPWLSRAQHEALWTAHMPMPMSERQKRWNNGNTVTTTSC